MSADTASTEPAATDVRDERSLGVPGSHDGDGHEYGTSDANYIKIALALMALTAAEVAASFMDLGRILVPLLLTMMAIKFFTVVLYFMHLKYDNRLFRQLFYTGLFLAIFVYAAAMLTFHYFE